MYNMQLHFHDCFCLYTVFTALKSSYNLYLAGAFIQSELQMKIIEAIKIGKRAMIHKCYNESRLA